MNKSEFPHNRSKADVENLYLDKPMFDINILSRQTCTKWMAMGGLDQVLHPVGHIVAGSESWLVV